MSKPTFRQAALNALSSPEELNKVLVVTKPGTWVALVAIVVVVLATLSWSILGSIPTTVEARGILVRPGGLQNATVLGNGILRNVVVQENEVVRLGDTIALIDAPDIALQLENAHQSVREADSMYRKAMASTVKMTQLDQAIQPNQREARKISTSAAQQRLETLQRLAEATKVLLDKGLVTRNEYYTSLEDVLKAQEAIVQLRTTAINDESQRSQAQYQREQELLRVEGQLTAAIRNTREIAQRYSQACVVRASCSGRITQIGVAEGSIVTPGTTIATIESDGGVVTPRARMLVAVFVSPAQGKKIRNGMVVNVVPTNIEASEYGSMTGVTRWISDYPLDAAGVRRFLSNDGVANYFGVNQEPPIGVLAMMDTDPSNPSGYRWTSGRGPSVRITTGTICSCYFVVDENPPIALLLPWLKRTLGLDA